jgi:hypothetical protein
MRLRLRIGEAVWPRGVRRNDTRKPTDDWPDLSAAPLERQLRASAYLDA